MLRLGTMALSRRFRALGKVGTAFALGWGLVGTAISFLSGGALVPSLLGYGIMFGAAGGISGIVTGLLVARGESGKAVEAISSWRASLWGLLGGLIPAAVLASIGVIEGAPDVVLPLIILGSISGGVGATVTGLAAASAKRVEAPAAVGEDHRIGA